MSSSEESGHGSPSDHVQIVRTEKFRRAFRKLEPRDRERVKSALTRLLADRSYPGLRLKRVQGTTHIWEIRAGRDIRITLEIDENAYILRNVGHHDATLKHP